MTPDTKKIIAFSGVAASLIIVTIILVIIQKNKEEAKEIAKEEKEIKEKEVAQNPNVVKPLFNRNKELINTYSQLKNRELIARSDLNIRTTPRIDNPTTYAPWDTNLLGKATKGQKIGKIVGEARGGESPSMRWFKVKLNKPIWKENTFWIPQLMALQFFTSESPQGTYEYAYVRADVATINQYTK